MHSVLICAVELEKYVVELTAVQVLVCGTYVSYHSPKLKRSVSYTVFLYKRLSLSLQHFIARKFNNGETRRYFYIPKCGYLLCLLTDYIKM